MKKLFILFVLLLAFSFSMGTAFGDVISLQNVVDAFNGRNDGNGMTVLFADGNSTTSAAGRSGLHSLGFTVSEAETYLSAYLSPTTYDGTWQNNYATLGNLRTGEFGDDSRLFFNSFCVNRSAGTKDNTYVNATLSFVDNGDGTYGTTIVKSATKTQSLTLGAALLYQDMLLGKLDMTPWTKWDKNPEAYYDQFGTYGIQNTIWAFQTGSLEKMLNSGGNTGDYVKNYGHAIDYLSMTYGGLFGDDLWWFDAYDPINHNIDGYSVLAVNLATQAGGVFQDHIILVSNPTAATPEPASILIFGLGLTGLGLVANRRKKRPSACVLAATRA